MVETLGPAFVIPQIDMIFAHITTLLQEKTVSQRTYLEQNAIIVGVEEANSHPIATATMDMLGSLLTALGANASFLAFYQQSWRSAASFFTVWNSADDIVSCYALATSLLEVYGEDAVFVVDDLLKMIPTTVTNPKEFCRANSYYALNLIMKFFSGSFASFVENAASILEAGLQGFPGDVSACGWCDGQTGRAADNAVYALVQMDKSYPGRFTETIFSLILPHLPLRMDHYEEESVVSYVMNVYETNPALFSKYAVQALTVYGKYLEPDMEEETEAYRVSDDAMGDG